MRRILLPLLALWAGRAAAAEVITVDDAVAQALRASDPLRAARYRTESAEDSARSARGRLLPALTAADTWQRYDSPFVLQIGPPGASPAITARESGATLFTLSGDQPVLGLLSRSRDLSAAARTAEASRADEENTRSLLAEQVRTTYLRLFEARAGIGIAQASTSQLQSQLRDAEARYAAGTITEADLLRFRTALANAQQQLIQAAAQEQVTRQSLLTLLSRDPREQDVQFLEPMDLERLAAEPVPEQADELVARALQRRPEVARAARQAEASRASGQARLLDLLPEVNVEASYSNAQGLPFQQPTNSAFVGVVTRWPFFTWGSRWYAARSARRQADAAEALREDARRQVALDVSSKRVQLQAQFAAVQAAETAIAGAEEAYRVTTAQLAVGAASTTDLLDAQAALTTAKLNLARARYERAVARVALDRASTAR